jgi:hypothetical protein
VECAKLDLLIPTHHHAAVLKHSDTFTFTAHDFSKPSPYYRINCVMRSRYYLDLPGWSEENHKKPQP